MCAHAVATPDPEGAEVKRSMTRSGLRFAVLAALVLALVLVPTALAGNAGNGGSSSSITLVPLDPDAGGANFGEQVTFNVSTNATKPWVEVACYQNGGLVYNQWHGFFPEYGWDQIFTLGPTQSWKGGDADCTGRLFVVSNPKTGRQTTLAITSFHAYA